MSGASMRIGGSDLSIRRLGITRSTLRRSGGIGPDASRSLLPCWVGAAAVAVGSVRFPATESPGDVDTATVQTAVRRFATAGKPTRCAHGAAPVGIAWGWFLAHP